MKNRITRHDQVETNKTTAFWLYEFAHDLDKKAHNVDYLKDYINKNYKQKKFNSIEEKLADIKERVGFDLAKKIVNEIEKTSSKEGDTGCGCGTKCKKCKGDCNCKAAEGSCGCQTKTASKKDGPKKKLKGKNKEDIAIMQNILNYITSMIQDQPHLDPMTVLSRCKEVDGLKYNNISNKIDQGKLMSFVEKLISSAGHDDHNHLIYYVPMDSNSLTDSKIDIAEYYNHAEPHRS